MKISFRRGNESDSKLVFLMFYETLNALGDRLGVSAISGGSDPEMIENIWHTRQGLFQHLARTRSQFWIAEIDKEPIGYARSIIRGNLHELTEFFVLPGYQGSGVGQGLLQRTYSVSEHQLGVIVATIDPPALVRYLKIGHTPMFPAAYFEREPELIRLNMDLEFHMVTSNGETLDIFDTIDQVILNHTRRVDHEWLLADRQGYLATRQGKPVGYVYIGRNNGPIAMINDADFPAVLAFAELQAVGNQQKVGFEVPLINQQAVQFLLSRGYRMDGFITLLMSTKPFGQFEKYIYTSPPFFI